MRYVYLVGAAKTGKSAIAKKLAATIPNSRIVDVPTAAQAKQINYPFGNLIDYRIEVHLGNLRAFESFSSHPKNQELDYPILANSPLTNLAYATTIGDNIVTYTGPEPDELQQWGLTIAYLWRLVQDSVWNDKFFWIPGNDGTDFGQEIERALSTIITSLEFDYTTLEGSVLQKYEKAARILNDV